MLGVLTPPSKAHSQQMALSPLATPPPRKWMERKEGRGEGRREGKQAYL